MFPSATAKRKALLRHEARLHHDKPGVVTISGKRYTGRVDRDPRDWLPSDGGATRGQRMVARILKSAMDSPPAQKALVTHDGVQFKVSSIGGDNATDVAWVLRCVRWMD